MAFIVACADYLIGVLNMGDFFNLALTPNFPVIGLSDGFALEVLLLLAVFDTSALRSVSGTFGDFGEKLVLVAVAPSLMPNPFALAISFCPACQPSSTIRCRE